MGSTSGMIWDDDSIVLNEYTYLQSIWATPIMEVQYKNDSIGVQEIECWQYSEDVPWTADTKWPSSAIEILEGLLGSKKEEDIHESDSTGTRDSDADQ